MQGSTKTQIRVCNAATPLKSWKIDHAGFLRCKTSVLRSCVLTYTPDELNLENIPAPLLFSKKVKLLVPEEELSRNDTLGSLEGRPVSVDHVWQSTLGADDVGNIAGSATYDPISKMVFADILVKDSDAIRRITAGEDDPTRLVEQSAGYLMTVDWVPGTTDDGEEYDGIQRNIQYNHVALVGEGEGRAGNDVRILNKRSSEKMSEDLVKIKVGEQYIRVHNADAGSLEKEMDSKDDMIANLINPDDHKKAKTDLDESRSKLEAANSDMAEKEGKIEELRAKVDELSDPARIQNAAKQLLKEQEDAGKIYNSMAGKAHDDLIKESIDKAKELQGVELHRHVVTDVRAMNKKPELSKDELENSSILRGRFDTLVELSDVADKTEVAGGGLTKAMNAKSSGEATGEYKTPDARRKHFHEIQNKNSR